MRIVIMWNYSMDVCQSVKPLDYLEESLWESSSDCLEKCKALIWIWVIACKTLESSYKIDVSKWKLTISNYLVESWDYLMIVWCGDNSLKVYVGQIIWKE